MISPTLGVNGNKILVEGGGADYCAWSAYRRIQFGYKKNFLTIFGGVKNETSV